MRERVSVFAIAVPYRRSLLTQLLAGFADCKCRPSGGETHSNRSNCTEGQTSSDAFLKAGKKLGANFGESGRIDGEL